MQKVFFTHIERVILYTKIRLYCVLTVSQSRVWTLQLALCHSSLHDHFQPLHLVELRICISTCAACAACVSVELSRPESLLLYLGCRKLIAALSLGSLWIAVD